jgi:hypothetical protein
MANCCSILQVSVHSKNRRGKKTNKNTEKPKNKIKISRKSMKSGCYFLQTWHYLHFFIPKEKERKS